MTNKAVLVRIAATSLILGVTMVGCTASRFSPVANASSPTGAAKSQAAKERKQIAKAIAQAEAAVAANPRDGAARTVLGQAYLAAGRFSSAETTFGDALAIDPTQGRAALSLALVQTALGKVDAARVTIATHETVIATADRGLALALAGDPQAAVTLLEASVRASEADAKTRQNLALSYALAGRWAEARTMAAYDLPANEADQRMLEWSQFSRPTSASDQVATLLGVTPVVDDGQPARLALAPAEVPVAVAEAVTAEADADVVAVAPTIVEPTPVSAETVANFSTIVFAPRAEIVQTLPSVERIAAFAPDRVAKVQTAAKMLRPGFQRAALIKPVADGQFVVQLGAFSNESRVETAWNSAIGRFGDLRDFSPSSTTYVRKMPIAATLYRLSIGGFETRSGAVQVCERIRSAGGACFVRGVAGDAPLQWAGRKTPARFAAR